MTRTSALAVFSAALGWLAGLTGAAPAQTADEFYKGKTIAVVVGSAPGGGFDAYARLFARHLPKHLPGISGTVVQNMPGAGGAIAAANVFSIAPQDGTVIGAIHPGVIMNPKLGIPSPQKIDPDRFAYLGNFNKEVNVCVLRTDAAAKSFQDLFTTEVLLGAAGGGTTEQFPTFLKGVLPVKLKIITGYKGNNEVFLAIDRGEVQGVCGAGYVSVLSQRPQWFRDGFARIVAQEAAEPHAGLLAQGVKRTIDFATTDAQRRVMEFYHSQLDFGRPYVAGPGVPKDRVALLRRAFAATVADPELRAEADKAQLEVEPLDGDKLQAVIARFYATEQAVVDRANAALGTPK